MTGQPTEPHAPACGPAPANAPRREIAHYLACVAFLLMGFAAGQFSASETLEVVTLDGRTHTLSTPGAPRAADLAGELVDLEAAALGFRFEEPSAGVLLPFDTTEPGDAKTSGVCTPRADGWIVCPVEPEPRTFEGEWR